MQSKKSIPTNKSGLGKTKPRFDSPFWSENSRIHLFFLVILVFVFYGKTFSFDWGLDDNYIIESVRNIENNWSGIRTIFSQPLGSDYRPVSTLSFWFEKQFSGELSPKAGHIVNVILFALIIIQIYRFLLLGKFYHDSKAVVVFALLVCIIFIVHPTHISVVANIKSRDNLLSMLFGLCSAIQFLKYINYKKMWHIAGMFILFGLAFLSKPDAYVFAFFPLMYLLIYRKANLNLILLGLIIVFITLSLFALIKGQLASEFLINKNVERVYIDSPLYENNTFLNRLSLSLTTLLYYIKFFVVPWGHYAYFGFNEIPLRGLFHPINVLSFFIFFGLLVWGIYSFKKNQKWPLFGFVFFLLSIAYASNLVLIVSGVLMDRYNFIGSLGLAMIPSGLFVYFFKISNVKQLISNWVIISVLAVFSIFTFIRIPDWNDTKTLLLKDIQKVDNSAHAHIMTSAIYINPIIFGGLTKPEMDENMKRGMYHINRALEITDKNPFVHESKGIAEIYYENYQVSLFHLKKAYQLDTNKLSALNYAGVVFRNQNMVDSALYYFEKVMNKENHFYYAANNYVSMLISTNQINKADSVLKVLSTRFPNDSKLKKKAFGWKATRRWEE